MKYAITGASGQLGRQTAHKVLELVDATDLVLLTRTPSSLAEFVR